MRIEFVDRIYEPIKNRIVVVIIIIFILFFNETAHIAVNTSKEAMAFWDIPVHISEVYNELVEINYIVLAFIFGSTSID